MDKNKVIKEVLLWIVMLIPFVYLFFSWTALPEQIPMHYNIEGEVDRWGSKLGLLYLMLGTIFGSYLLMHIIPLIDPKKKIRQMGEKYTSLRIFMIFIMVGLSMFIMFDAQYESLRESSFLIVFVGLMLAVLGNYIQAVKPNYFIGIRTPWSLENEQVWKKTHRLGGRMWVVGGILLAVLPLIIKSKALNPIYFSIVILLAVVPVVMSYIYYVQDKNGTGGLQNGHS